MKTKKRNLIETVLRSMRNYDMVSPLDNVLAAVSGGPDSVFLLYALCKLRSKLKIKELSVCNLDHGLRGKESKDDSQFVKKLAETMGLKFAHKTIKLAGAERAGLSTEEVARRERYKFYCQAAAKTRSNVVATGHTLDDHAETIIMRIIKGSSTKGMLGISPKRKEGELSVVRPLIEIEKAEITEFLDANAIPYRIDRTNLEPIYFRNIVRGEIMPFLEKYNPRLKRVLFNLSQHLREDYDYIDEARKKNRSSIATGRDGSVELKLSQVVTQPRALQKEILRDSLESSGGEVKKLSFKHWKEVENLLKRKGKGFSLDLPGGVRVTRTEKTLVFSRLPHS